MICFSFYRNSVSLNLSTKLYVNVSGIVMYKIVWYSYVCRATKIRRRKKSSSLSIGQVNWFSVLVIYVFQVGIV